MIHIKNFLEKTKQAKTKNQNVIALQLHDAEKLAHDISLFLADYSELQYKLNTLTQQEQSPTSIDLDGGNW